MNTRIKILLGAFTLAIMAVLTSCDKNDDVPKPVISGLELGIGNSHVAYIGQDLHVEAEIVAEGKISKVIIEIHQVEGSSDEIEVIYDEFAGLKNATFHKHVDIPETTAAGKYHCHIIVTDMEGNQTMVEEEISIEELADETAPVLTISSAPENGQTFVSGETISISGKITDNISLAGMVIALVYASDNIADDDVTGSNKKVIVMLHTHDFEKQDEHTFTASIVVGAPNDNNTTPAPIQGSNAWKSGNYYILVKGRDAKRNAVSSERYPIVINL